MDTLPAKDLREVPMLKTALIVAATAVLSFGAGIWTEATLAEHHRTETGAVSIPSTISPAEMHRKVKPDDLPVQYMQGDFY
jgi:hypothetical protein